MAKVFISHQKKDSRIAENIAGLLKAQMIDYFLDVYDPIIGTYATPLDTYIIDVLDGCSHLLTVLSVNTQESWWVPFEIGVATEKDIPIANFFYDMIEVPDYLTNWPYLQTEEDLNNYFRIIKKGKKGILLDHKIAGIEPRYSEAFHKELKAKLRQS